MVDPSPREEVRDFDERVVDGRLPPFSWQDKEALRLMRGFFTGEALVYLRSTYVALTEVASDHPDWGGVIDSSRLLGGQKAICSYSGVEWKSHTRSRRILELLGLVSSEELRSPKGQRAGAIIRLLPTPIRGDGLPREKRFNSLSDLREIQSVLETGLGMDLGLSSCGPLGSRPCGRQPPHVEEQDVVEEHLGVEVTVPDGTGAAVTAGPPEAPKAPETREEFAAALCAVVRNRAKKGELPSYTYELEAGFDLIALLAKAAHKGLEGNGVEAPSLFGLRRLLESLEKAQDIPTPPVEDKPWGYYAWRVGLIVDSDGPVPPFDFALSGKAPDGRSWEEVLRRQ